jgi:hypothetical protein
MAVWKCSYFKCSFPLIAKVKLQAGCENFHPIIIFESTRCENFHPIMKALAASLRLAFAMSGKEALFCLFIVIEP